MRTLTLLLASHIICLCFVLWCCVMCKVVVITDCSSRVWHGAAASGWLVLGWCSSRPLDSIFSTASYSSRAVPAQPSTTARPGTASTKGTLAQAGLGLTEGELTAEIVPRGNKPVPGWQPQSRAGTATPAPAPANQLPPGDAAARPARPQVGAARRQRYQFGEICSSYNVDTAAQGSLRG